MEVRVSYLVAVVATVAAGGDVPLRWVPLGHDAALYPELANDVTPWARAVTTNPSEEVSSTTDSPSTTNSPTMSDSPPILPGEVSSTTDSPSTTNSPTMSDSPPIPPGEVSSTTVSPSTTNSPTMPDSPPIPSGEVSSTTDSLSTTNSPTMPPGEISSTTDSPPMPQGEVSTTSDSPSTTYSRTTPPGEASSTTEPPTTPPGEASGVLDAACLLPFMCHHERLYVDFTQMEIHHWDLPERSPAACGHLCVRQRPETELVMAKMISSNEQLACGCGSKDAIMGAPLWPGRLNDTIFCTTSCPDGGGTCGGPNAVTVYELNRALDECADPQNQGTTEPSTTPPGEVSSTTEPLTTPPEEVSSTTEPPTTPPGEVSSTTKPPTIPPGEVSGVLDAACLLPFMCHSERYYVDLTQMEIHHWDLPERSPAACGHLCVRQRPETELVIAKMIPSNERLACGCGSEDAIQGAPEWPGRLNDTQYCTTPCPDGGGTCGGPEAFTVYKLNRSLGECTGPQYTYKGCYQSTGATGESRTLREHERWAGGCVALCGSPPHPGAAVRLTTTGDYATLCECWVPEDELGTALGEDGWCGERCPDGNGWCGGQKDGLWGVYSVGSSSRPHSSPTLPTLAIWALFVVMRWWR